MNKNEFRGPRLFVFHRNCSISTVSPCPCVLRLTSTAQPERKLPEHGQRKGIQGAELCRDAAHKHWSHDQDTGGADTVSKYVTLMHMGNKTRSTTLHLSVMYGLNMTA